VVARSPTWTYLGQRFAQRHAAIVVGTAIAMLAILAGLGLALRAWSQAETARQREAEQSQAAEGARKLAQSEADKLRATQSFLLTMLTTDEPATFAPDVQLRQVIDEAVESLDEGALRDQPDVDASLRTTLARVYLTLRLHEKAERQARRAYELRAAPAMRDTRDYAETLSVLASAVHERGRYVESETLRRESLDLHRRIHGAESLEAMRQMHGLASVLRDQRDLAEAEQLTRDALDLAIRLTGERSLETAEARHRLAWLLIYSDVKESEHQARQALAIREALRGRNDPLVAETLVRLGRTLHLAGDYEGGKAALREAVSIAQDRSGKQHPKTLRHMSYLVTLLNGGREYEAAEEVCTQMLEGWRAYPGTYEDNVAVALATLARLRAQQGNLAGAEELHRQALAMLRGELGEQHRSTASQWLHLSDFLIQADRLAEAEAVLTEAIASQRTALRSGHEFVAGSLDRLAQVFERQGRAEDCERVKKESVEILRAACGDADDAVVKCVGQLAALTAGRGEPGARERAVAVLADHADRLRRTLDPERGTPRAPDTALALALTLRMLSQTYHDGHDFRQAAAAAREAIAATSADSPLRRIRIAWADGHYWLGVALLGQRAYAEAESGLLRCHQTCTDLGVTSRWPRYTRQHLIRLYEEWDAAAPGQGHAAKAAEWRREPAGAAPDDR